VAELEKRRKHHPEVPAPELRVVPLSGLEDDTIPGAFEDILADGGRFFAAPRIAFPFDPSMETVHPEPFAEHQEGIAQAHAPLIIPGFLMLFLSA
jgi:hypothetical protein